MADLPADPSLYLNRITSEHNQQPDFIAFLTALLQPLVDQLEINSTDLMTAFDLDTAVGVQLDAVGVWIGRSRQLSVPITGVYFTFDIGPGFDKGIFRGPFDPPDSIVSLPDDQYRILLYATVAANHWDGTIPGAYAAYAIIFGPGGYVLMIRDWQDMSMDLILAGPVPDALTLALFEGGYLSLKPVGVRIRDYISPGVPGKMFMFDAPPSSPYFAGFDKGAFANVTPGN